VKEPASRVKPAELDPAAIVTDDGAVSKLLTSDTTTLAPPVGAFFVNVTVQAAEALGPRLVGLQANDETSTDATRVMAALAEVLL
jgi:hypothetical protein